MGWIGHLIRLEVWLFLGALLGIVFLHFAFHPGCLTGLLQVKRGRRQQKKTLSPARVQLLVFTLTGAFLLLTRVLTGATDTLEFPPEFAAAFGGSSAFYLGRKHYQRLGR